MISRRSFLGSLLAGVAALAVAPKSFDTVFESEEFSLGSTVTNLKVLPPAAGLDLGGTDSTAYWFSDDGFYYLTPSSVNNMARQMTAGQAKKNKLKKRGKK